MRSSWLKVQFGISYAWNSRSASVRRQYGFSRDLKCLHGVSIASTCCQRLAKLKIPYLAGRQIERVPITYQTNFMRGGHMYDDIFLSLLLASCDISHSIRCVCSTDFQRLFIAYRSICGQCLLDITFREDICNFAWSRSLYDTPRLSR